MAIFVNKIFFRLKKLNKLRRIKIYFIELLTLE